MRHVVNGTPVVLGGALIVPAGLMQQRRGDEPADPVAAALSADAAARSRIERLAMKGRCAGLKNRRDAKSSMFPLTNADGI